ncbi:MAG: TolC family protein [Bacteroidota bacterium]|nr:TolC family protein [Bacteroidota bacterium]MDP4216807.1 TolC family protein [Bacteroidota bacterium]MDP4246929.1 TolC family protein [Bacteroidota bacterium]MDP4252906.1 TolC family protein [Bacteroidota bacterium]MDP4259754.1 TolC family protein [Bacteroidota bacterium]
MKPIISLCLLIGAFHQGATAQTLKLTDILDTIRRSHPSVKMYDAEIRSMDAAAKGAHSWMAPEISTGFWMTPYNVNLWKRDASGAAGMGQYMISGEQMFPNKKYNDANAAYMESLSSVEKENKNAGLNELFAAAKENYNSWIVIQKKIALIEEDGRLLQLMVTNAETRYKNGLGKISAYYKATAALANLANLRVMLENDAIQRRIALNTLMHRDRSTAFSIDTAYTVSDYSATLFDSTLFYAGRSDIKAIDRNIQSVYLKEQMEKQSLAPQFGVQFSHMFGFGGLPQQFSLMGIMRIPFARWSARESKANIESLRWKAVSLEGQKEAMANEYAGMADGIRQDMAAKQRQLQLFEKNIIPALRKNYQSMLLGYEQNTEELFALYDAWETLNNTQLEYLDQVQQLLSLQVNLEKILEIK